MMNLFLFCCCLSCALAAPVWEIVYGSHNGQVLASGVLRAAMLAPHAESTLRQRWPGAAVRAVDSRAFETSTTRLDVCVCAKCNGLMVEELCRVCHERGGRFVWEVLDLKPCVDLWLTSSRVAASLFESVGAKRAVAVPHHHTNLDNVVSVCRRDSPVRVVAATFAQVNEPTAFDADLARLLARDDIAFRPILSKYVLESPSAENNWNQAGFHVGLDDVDVAVIWPPFDDLQHVALRPVTRLAHWWSHGIPTIFFRSVQAYVDAVIDAGGVGAELACGDIECVVARVRQLSADPELRCRHAAAALEASQRFNVSNSAAEYVAAIQANLR